MTKLNVDIILVMDEYINYIKEKVNNRLLVRTKIISFSGLLVIDCIIWWLLYLYYLMYNSS